MNGPTEVSDAALSLCQSGIDVLCQISDNLSNSSFPAIARACEMAKTPLFTFSPSQVKRGAALGIGSDFSENGREAGRLVALVIRGNDPVADSVSRHDQDHSVGQPRQRPTSRRRDPARMGQDGRRGRSRPTRHAVKDASWTARSTAPLDVAELVLIGSLDSSWSSYLSDRIDEVIRGGALEVRIDMAGISYLSSNGIALLVRYHQQLRKIGGRHPHRGRFRIGQPRAPADGGLRRSSAMTGRPWRRRRIPQPNAR